MSKARCKYCGEIAEGICNDVRSVMYYNDKYGILIAAHVPITKEEQVLEILRNYRESKM